MTGPLEITQIDPRAIRAWQRLLERLARLNDKLYRCKILRDLYELEAAHARRHGVTIDFIDPKILPEIVRKVDRLKRAARAVQDNKLGVRLQNGDLDIMAPSWYTQEQIAGILGGWFIPVLIGIGIVAIGSVIATATFYETKVVDPLAKRYNAIVEETDKRYCADPASELCTTWIRDKVANEYQPRKNLADKIGDAFRDIGSGAKRGLGVGLAILIPLGAYLLFRKGKN